MDYTVYYNAVKSEQGAHLLAVGWCSEAGWTPKFEKNPETNVFRFELVKNGDVAAQVITPFAVTAEIPDPPRSILVEDNYNKYQLRANEINSGGTGENTSGKWIKSSKSMNKCNLALNANINLKEDPPGLYVHGSVMVYTAETEVTIKKAEPQGFNPNNLLLNLTIMHKDGPMKGIPRHFFYEEHGKHVDRFTNVLILSDKGKSYSAEITVFG